MRCDGEKVGHGCRGGYACCYWRPPKGRQSLTLVAVVKGGTVMIVVHGEGGVYDRVVAGVIGMAVSKV